MNTECSDCLFYEMKQVSEYYNDPSLGHGLINCCGLEKDKLYKEKGVSVYKNPSENKMILYKFICPFHRTKGWSKENENLAGKTYDEVEEYIVEENGFPYSCFIYENGEIDLELAVDQVLRLDHPPQYLHVTFKYMHQDDALMHRIVNKIEAIKPAIKYKLAINLDEELDHIYESTLTFLLNVKTTFIALFQNNYDLPADITTELSRKIQKDLLSFPYANTPNNEFLFLPTTIIQEYKAIEGQYFLEKIMETQCLNYKFQ